MSEKTETYLGWLEVCLNVKSLKKSMEFYLKMGFEEAGGDVEEGWVVLEYEGYRIALYENIIAENILNFRGGDVHAIAKELKARGFEMEIEADEEDDGSVGCVLRDPDGNQIYFNTHPDELEEDGEEHGDGCDCCH